jgi:predicted Zn-dependent protease
MQKLLTLLLVFCGLSMSYGDVTDDEIESYILRQSNIALKQYISSHGTVDVPVWDEAISSAFTKLITNSGESSFNAVYAIINDSDFNAGCLPGGQFIINKGALELFDG